MNRRAQGSAGEQAACDYLTGQGWKILDRNVRRGRGEIDVIACRGDLTAFIEVKKRSSLRCGRPAEAVNREKCRRIVNAAAIYIQEKNLADARLRFDVIEILPGQIRHIEGAFDATDIFEN